MIPLSGFLIGCLSKLRLAISLQVLPLFFCFSLVVTWSITSREVGALLVALVLPLVLVLVALELRDRVILARIAPPKVSPVSLGGELTGLAYIFGLIHAY